MLPVRHRHAMHGQYFWNVLLPLYPSMHSLHSPFSFRFALGHFYRFTFRHGENKNDFFPFFRFFKCTIKIWAHSTLMRDTLNWIFISNFSNAKCGFLYDTCCTIIFFANNLWIFFHSFAVLADSKCCSVAFYVYIKNMENIRYKRSEYNFFSESSDNNDNTRSNTTRRLHDVSARMAKGKK